jgi:hypothetical protein
MFGLALQIKTHNGSGLLVKVSLTRIGIIMKLEFLGIIIHAGFILLNTGRDRNAKENFNFYVKRKWVATCILILMRKLV